MSSSSNYSLSLQYINYIILEFSNTILYVRYLAVYILELTPKTLRPQRVKRHRYRYRAEDDRRKEFFLPH